MQVVILCGGRGSRLGPETEIRPKPMVQIGERPILWHIMRYYAHFGHTDFILCLGYKGEIIKNYFLNFEVLQNDVTLELGKPGTVSYQSNHDARGWKLTLADTGLDTYTGARVKRVERYIEGDDFLLTYGDGLSSVDLARLVDFHRSHGRIATVTAVHPPARFGELQIDDGCVTRFSEKPQTSAGMINGGFFVFSRKIFEYLSDDETSALEHKPMVRLAGEEQLMAYEHPGFWQCVDTVRELDVLRGLWAGGEAPWKVW